ncbi:Hypothetical protein POVR1_LOCUS471 [uncultured virus]|nr:Hypothetical protein POVR1_LOCUS471 [uncultured virus]
MNWEKLIEYDYGVAGCTFDPKLLYALIQETGLAHSDKRKRFNNVFFLACKYGCTEMVKYLLTRYDVDPGCDDSESLVIACKFEFLEIMKLLLDDPRVKITEQAVVNAVKSRNIEVVKVLILAPSILQPRCLSICRDDVMVGLKLAFKIGDLSLVNFFIEEFPTRPRDFFTDSVRDLSCVHWTIEVMERILKCDLKVTEQMVKRLIIHNRIYAEMLANHPSFTGDKVAIFGVGG